MTPKTNPTHALDYTGERFEPEMANALAHYDHHARYEFVRRNFGGGRLLDVGCGLGVGSRFLASRFEEVLGVDPSEDAIQRARSITSEANVRFERIDVLGQKGAPGGFDRVTCLEVIEHTNAQDELLSLVVKALKPDGLAIISTPNIVHTRLHQIKNEFHVRELTRQEFGELLKRHFKHVHLCVMVQQNSIAVVSAESDAREVTVNQVASTPRKESLERFPEEVITNFIAVCSQAPLSVAIRPVVVADPYSTYVAELEEIVRKQTGMVDERDALIRSQQNLIEDRDSAIQSQTRMIDERDMLIREQGANIERSAAALQQQQLEIARLGLKVLDLEADLAKSHPQLAVLARRMDRAIDLMGRGGKTLLKVAQSSLGRTQSVEERQDLGRRT
jgi:2-polyprenyl-3-methyl-5-hydroxy-6-metoxy-1,4-benzoquinol methylase